MKTLIVTLSLTLFSLTACQRAPSDAPKPHAGNAATAPSTMPGTSTAATQDPSIPSQVVPDAMPRTSEAQKNADPMSTMTKQEESTAMPKPAQANDHSSTALEDSKK